MSLLNNLKKSIKESKEGRKDWHSMLGNKHDFEKAQAKKLSMANSMPKKLK